jgi:hypothetical protein
LERGVSFLDWKFLARDEGRGGGKLGEEAFWKLSQGTVVVGNFGLGGQETARIPGAREPKRLFLVGWEVNIQLGILGKLKNKRTRDQIRGVGGREKGGRKEKRRERECVEMGGE